MAYVKTNWVNGQTPINATNLNKIEQGIEDATITPKTTKTTSDSDVYACNYINNALIEEYSANEEMTNKVWIDGKPIWRKIYYNASYSQSASKTKDITFSLPNLDKVVNVYGGAKVSGINFPLPNSMWANANGMQYSWNISSFTSTGFKINTGSDNPINNIEIWLVIEYTVSSE